MLEAKNKVLQYNYQKTQKGKKQYVHLNKLREEKLDAED